MTKQETEHHSPNRRPPLSVWERAPVSHSHPPDILTFPFFLLPDLIGQRVDFLCVPCRPAEECGWLRKRHQEEDSGRETGRAGECNPCLALGGDQPRPEPVCAAADRGNGTGPGTGYEGGDADPGLAWFMCETDMEEAYLSGSGVMSGR